MTDLEALRRAALVGVALAVVIGLVATPTYLVSLLTYSAEPGSRSEDAMRELARWSETRTKLSAAPAGPET